MSERQVRILSSMDDVRRIIKTDYSSCGKEPDKAIFLGNGFGKAYSPSDFDWEKIDKKTKIYNKSHSKSTLDLDNLVCDLGTYNAEDVLEVLENAIKVAKYSNDANQAQIASSIQLNIHELEYSFIRSIVDIQPSTRTAIHPRYLDSCMHFLEEYSKIFTVNYDLLVYWVILHSNEIHRIKKKKNKWRDGFLDPIKISLDSKSKNSILVNKWPISRYGAVNDKTQNVYYLHGAVHIFCSGSNIDDEEFVKLRYDKLQPKNILTRVRELASRGIYPVFVASGSSDSKRLKIQRNRYLKYCYSNLKSFNGVIVTFGWSIALREMHLIDAMIKGNCQALFIGIRGSGDGSTLTRDEIDVRIRRRVEKSIREDKKPYRLDVYYYDSSKYRVWR